MQREQRRAPIRHRRDDVRHAGRAAVLGLHRIGQDVGAQPHAFSDPLHESGEASTIVDDKVRPVAAIMVPWSSKASTPSYTARIDIQ